METNNMPYYTIIDPYTDEEINIIESIPKEWLHITDEEVHNLGNDYGGPVYCNNCKYHGTINNVWVGYCANCAVYRYNNEVNAFHWPGRQYVYEGQQCIEEVTDNIDKWDDYLKLYHKEFELEKNNEINYLKNLKNIPPKTSDNYQKLVDLNIVSWDEYFDFMEDKDYLVVSKKVK